MLLISYFNSLYHMSRCFHFGEWIYKFIVLLEWHTFWNIGIIICFWNKYLNAYLLLILTRLVDLGLKFIRKKCFWQKYNDIPNYLNSNFSNRQINDWNSYYNIIFWVCRNVDLCTQCNATNYLLLLTLKNRRFNFKEDYWREGSCP